MIMEVVLINGGRELAAIDENGKRVLRKVVPVGMLKRDDDMLTNAKAIEFDTAGEPTCGKLLRGDVWWVGDGNHWNSAMDPEA